MEMCKLTIHVIHVILFVEDVDLRRDKSTLFTGRNENRKEPDVNLHSEVGVLTM